MAKNSVTAGATRIEITVDETPQRITIAIRDNGCGMTPEFVSRVTDPFTTTRTTRKVGMGLPLMKMEAQMSGGDLSIESAVGVGTTVTSWFDPQNIDMPPLGDLVSSIITLIQGSPDIDFVFTHKPAQAHTRWIPVRSVRSWGIFPSVSRRSLPGSPIISMKMNPT